MSPPYKLAFLAACIVSTASPLSAHSKSAPGFGPWKFEEYKTPPGKHYCSIMSAVMDQNTGQNLIIKGSESNDYLTIDLYKDRWVIPNGKTVPVIFDFSDNEPLKIDAYGMGHVLDVRIPTSSIAIFLGTLADAPQMQVIFPGGSEGNWFIPSANVKRQLSQMVSCLQRAQKHDTSPTGLSDTQPFGN
jgi:hypothetical protein